MNTMRRMCLDNLCFGKRCTTKNQCKDALFACPDYQKKVSCSTWILHVDADSTRDAASTMDMTVSCTSKPIACTLHATRSVPVEKTANGAMIFPSSVVGWPYVGARWRRRMILNIAAVGAKSMNGRNGRSLMSRNCIYLPWWCFLAFQAHPRHTINASLLFLA